MAKFSDNSKKELRTCDERLQLLMNMLIRKYDVAVIEGHRGKKRQNNLYKEGRSKLEYPNSKHNSDPSLAVDIAPYPIDWEQTNRFYYMAGKVMTYADFLDIPLRWGGDWDGDHKFQDQTFDDLVHFEIDET